MEKHDNEYNNVSEELEKAASKKHTEGSEDAWVTKNKNIHN